MVPSGREWDKRKVRNFSSSVPIHFLSTFQSQAFAWGWEYWQVRPEGTDTSKDKQCKIVV